MPRFLRAALLTLFFSTASATAVQLPEEQTWSITVHGGVSVAVGEALFNSQYYMGYNAGLSADYTMSDHVSLGMFIDRNWFTHNGRSAIRTFEGSKCLGGGDQELTAGGMRVRVDLFAETNVKLYLLGKIGAVEIFRDKIYYSYFNTRPVLPSATSVNLFGGVGFGMELPLTRTFYLGVEGELRATEMGTIMNQFVPVRVTGRLQL
jgi:hypothetical protein